MQTGTKQLLLSNLKAWLQSNMLFKATSLVEGSFAAITDQVAEALSRLTQLALNLSRRSD